MTGELFLFYLAIGMVTAALILIGYGVYRYLRNK